MLTLALESSCDETAVAILNNHKSVYKSEIFSQAEIHKNFGGVVPEIAARKHLEIFPYLIKKVIFKSKTTIKNIDIIAATGGPGLTSSVLVGIMHAKTIASIIKKSFIAINHLEGHLLIPKINNKELKFPYFLLLISGGHCQIIFVEKMQKYQIASVTEDESVGELYDKISKILNLGYPGGNIIEKYSNYNKKKISIKDKMKKKYIGYNFSFSGLKTYIIKKICGQNFLNEEKIFYICKLFQLVVSKTIIRKIIKSLILFNYKYKESKRVAISGGVASNKYIKSSVFYYIKSIGYRIYFPNKDLCTDNAVMIAYAGIKKFGDKGYCNLNFRVKKSWDIT